MSWFWNLSVAEKAKCSTIAAVGGNVAAAEHAGAQAYRRYTCRETDPMGSLPSRPQVTDAGDTVASAGDTVVDGATDAVSLLHKRK